MYCELSDWHWALPIEDLDYRFSLKRKRKMKKLSIPYSFLKKSFLHLRFLFSEMSIYKKFYFEILIERVRKTN